MHNKVMDPTAVEARKGKDIQGIPWERLSISREKYRLTRLSQYKNYENVPNSGEESQKVLTTILHPEVGMTQLYSHIGLLVSTVLVELHISLYSCYGDMLVQGSWIIFSLCFFVVVDNIAFYNNCQRQLNSLWYKFDVRF